MSFEAVFPNALETRDKAKRFLKDRGLSIPFSLDEGARRAVRNNVEVVPTVILFDQAGKQIYFGAFDDAKASNIVKVSFLEDAIEQFLSGKKVQRPFGKPFGCFLMP